MTDRAQDRALMERIALGEEAALKELHERFAAEAVGLASKILGGDQAAAEDVVQEVFVTLWNEPSRYDPDKGSLGGWLMAWVKNRSIDQGRRKGAYDRAKQRASDRLDEVWKPITRADRTGLENALSTLPSEQRELLERMYYDGLTQAAISEDTGIALGTVKSRIRLGMERLRDAFKRALPRVRGQGKRGEHE